MSISTEITQDRTHIIDTAVSEGSPDDDHPPRPNHHHYGNTLLMKIISPVITFVDRPWKVSERFKT